MIICFNLLVLNYSSEKFESLRNWNTFSSITKRAKSLSVINHNVEQDPRLQGRAPGVTGKGQDRDKRGIRQGRDRTR